MRARSASVPRLGLVALLTASVLALTVGTPTALATEAPGLTIRVVDQQTLDPVAGAAVSLVEEGAASVAFRGTSGADGTLTVPGRTSRAQLLAGEILLGASYRVRVLDAGDHAHDYWAYDKRWEIPSWATTSTVLEAHVVAYQDPDARLVVDGCHYPEVTVRYLEDEPASWSLGAPWRLDRSQDVGTVTFALNPAEGTPWHAEAGWTASLHGAGSQSQYPTRQRVVLQNGDEVVAGRRIMSDRTLVVRTTIDCQPRGLATSRAVVSDGRLFVAALSADGSVAVRERSAATDSWAAWLSLGVPPSAGTLTAVPVRSDGYVFVMTVGEDGRLYYRTRKDATDAWSGSWTDRGSPEGVRLVGTPAAIESDGYLFVTALGEDGRMWTASRNITTGRWSGWLDRGGPTGVTLVNSISPVRSDGYLFLTALSHDGQLWTRSRNEATNRWSGWIRRGAPSGVRLVGKPTPVVSDGYLFVVALGDDGAVWTRSRNETTGGWSGWILRSIDDSDAHYGGAVGAAVSDRRLWLVSRALTGAAQVRGRSATTGNWSNWWSLAQPAAPTRHPLLDATTVLRFDGGLWVIGLGNNGMLYTKVRDEATNDWSDWARLGSSSGPVFAG